MSGIAVFACVRYVCTCVHVYVCMCVRVCVCRVRLHRSVYDVKYSV